MSTRLVALLPIKANSERVPGKNFKLLAGKPLFRWILDTLLSIDTIEQVVVNTDVPDRFHDLATIDRRLIVRERKASLCGDKVSMNLVLRDDMDAVASETYLMTHATNPMLSANTIKRALGLYRNGDCDSVFGANRMQSRFYDSRFKPINHDPDNLLPTQELESWFEENSCLYVFSRASFLATSSRIGKKPAILETPKLESIDIDTPDDWIMAEALALRGLE